MKKHAFDGRIISNDPNLNFMFQGVFSLSPRTRNSVYKFYANLGYADLNALNFDKRGTSKISLQASANFNRRRSGDLLGSMEISDIMLENDAGRYDIGDIEMNSYFGDELYRMRMTSSFADASFAGSERITKFFSDLQNVTLKRELPALFRDTTAVEHKDRYRIAFRLKNSMDFLAFVAPGLYISDSTSLDMSIDTLGIFKADLKSPRIAFNENYIRKLEMKMDNMNGSLGGKVSGQTMSIAGISLENNSFQLFAHNDFIGFGYTYENPGTLVNKGEIFITCNVRKNEGAQPCFHIEMLPSRLLLNSREWNINHSCLHVGGKEMDIEKVEFTSGDQTVRLSGDSFLQRCLRSISSAISMHLLFIYSYKRFSKKSRRLPDHQTAGDRNKRMMLRILQGGDQFGDQRIGDSSAGLIDRCKRRSEIRSRGDIVESRQSNMFRNGIPGKRNRALGAESQFIVMSENRIRLRMEPEPVLGRMESGLHGIPGRGSQPNRQKRKPGRTESIAIRTETRLLL